MKQTRSSCLTSPEADVLELVAQLPLAPITHIAPFATTGDRATLYRRIAHLVERGLITALHGPPHSRCRPRQLLLITNLGLAVLAWRSGLDCRELVRRWGLSHSAIATLLRQLPAVLSVYELLALLAACRAGWKARVLSWHGPWGSTGSTCWAGGVRLPHCVLEWQSDREQTLLGKYVLVADAGALPPLALRSRLARLAQMQPSTGRPAPVVAIATTSHRRAEAWSAVLASVANARRGGFLESCIDTWGSWRSGRVVIPRTGHSESERQCPRVRISQRSHEQFRPWSYFPRPIDLERAHAALAEWDISAGGRAALDIIGRHPFLPTSSLGDVLGGNHRRALMWRNELVRRGLIRILAREEVPTNVRAEGELLEATVWGLTRLAGSMGLSLAVAVRHHGLAGGGPLTPVGTRRVLHANMAHTVGADGVFVTIARSARAQREGALLEWRNAAACVWGRMRPDGYGLLRLGPREYGFFVEFDRGTVHPRALRSKFAAYHRYKSTPMAARYFDGFPITRVTTTGPAGEQRVLEAVRAVCVGEASRVPVLVTTIGWLQSDRGAIWGRIWRDPIDSRRRAWPMDQGAAPR
jgi:hypothetical protein